MVVQVQSDFTLQILFRFLLIIFTFLEFCKETLMNGTKVDFVSVSKQVVVQ
jgi:hypothetical protein